MVDGKPDLPEEARQVEDSKKDPKKFEVLYERYFDQIFGFILNRVNDRNHTADLTSQTFLKALVNIEKFKFQGLPFSAWLYRIAVNECNQFFRDSKNVRFVVFDDFFAGKIEGELVDNSQALLSGKYQRIKDSLQYLSMEEMQLLELRFFEEKPFKEVAYILNITENNAKVRTYRVLDKIKKQLNKK